MGHVEGNGAWRGGSNGINRTGDWHRGLVGDRNRGRECRRIHSAWNGLTARQGDESRRSRRATRRVGVMVRAGPVAGIVRMIFGPFRVAVVRQVTDADARRQHQRAAGEQEQRSDQGGQHNPSRGCRTLLSLSPAQHPCDLTSSGTAGGLGGMCELTRNPFSGKTESEGRAILVVRFAPRPPSPIAAGTKCGTRALSRGAPQPWCDRCPHRPIPPPDTRPPASTSRPVPANPRRPPVKFPRKSARRSSRCCPPPHPGRRTPRPTTISV